MGCLDASGNGGPSGYRHYSAPVAGSTVADLATTAADGGFAPVVNPAGKGWYPSRNRNFR